MTPEHEESKLMRKAYPIRQNLVFCCLLKRTTVQVGLKMKGINEKLATLFTFQETMKEGNIRL